MPQTREQENAARRARYVKNKERILARNKEWLSQNKEKVTAQAKIRGAKWRAANREKIRLQSQEYNRRPERREYHRQYLQKHNLEYRYGITQEQYAALVKAQGGACSICGKVPQKLHVDHNHKTGKVRELLCHSCNTAIGHLKESPELLMKAIAYLEKHR